MIRQSATSVTHYSESRESNLSAAKRALKQYRGAYLHREASADDDVICIVVGGEIIEKHICKLPHRVSTASHTTVRPVIHRLFRIEDLALYQ